MRKIFIILICLGILGGAAYWSLSGRDYVLRFSEDELRDHLDARLPYEGSHFYVFDVTLDNARIDLVEGADRIAGGVDVAVRMKLGSRELFVSGAADVSGGVRYDADQRAFFLEDPVVEELHIPGVLERHANRANSAISAALGEFYRTRPIYVLEADTAAKSAARMLLKHVEVKDEHLVVTLRLGDAVEKQAE